MKACDRVSFHLNKNSAYPKGSQGACRVTLIREERDDGIFHRGESNREIDCGEAGLPGNAIKAFALIYTGEYGNNGAWQALCRIVKPGDQLIFRAGENRNQYVAAATIAHGAVQGVDAGYGELFSDELSVTVRRKGKDVIRELGLAYSTCPNNSARMITVRSKEYSLKVA